MTVTIERESDVAADDLLRQCIRDILPSVTMADVFSSFVLPARALSRAKFANRADAWTAIREHYPRGASFPLGFAAERAIRRAHDKPPEELAREFLFETAMLDLRGSSDTLNRDYGFWYHWHPDGTFRTLDEERELRTRIREACARRVAELREHVPANAELTGGVVDHALREVFHTGPEGAPRRAFNAIGIHADDDARKRYPLDPQRVEIVLHGEGQNVELSFAGVNDDRVRDLLDIATFFYFADIYVPRDHLFARELALLIPVRLPELWERHRGAIERLCSFLTGNRVSVRFIAGPGTSKQTQSFRITDPDRSVVLFSGGLDSFAGAASALGERDDAILVSHSASPMLVGMQRKLIAHFNAKHVVQAPTSVFHDTAYRDRVGVLPDQELYQHGRSFLFLSLATAVALANGAGRVRMYENGPVALNVMFSEARLNTRTAHPLVLQWFEDLINGVFETAIVVENPFETLTKGEVVQTLDEKHHEAIALTNSCWRYARVKTEPDKYGVTTFEGWHCGRCIPCVWRRAAIKAADLEEFDDTYLWDKVPEREWSRFLDRKDFTVILDLYRAALATEAARNDAALLDLFPELETNHIGMHRQYAAELLDFFAVITPRLFHKLET